MLAKFIMRIAALSLMAASSIAEAQTPDCNSEVTVSGPRIEVTSTGADDTENLDCALDKAAAEGYREILLTSRNYSISSVSVEKFTGDLKGISSDRTLISVRDGSLDCAADEPASVFRFGGGAPAIRNLTVSVSEPCAASGQTAYVILFTGEFSSCDRRTVMGTVDRIVIEGTGAASDSVVTAVGADTALACDFTSQQINGGLVVNKAIFSALDFGIISSLGNSSPADLTFNTFSEVGLPISVVNARQATKIFRNTFNYNDVPSYANDALGSTAVFVGSTSLSPIRNSTLIQDNDFNDIGQNSSPFAVISGQADKQITHSVTILDNRFNGSVTSQNATGIAILDTPGGIVAGNTFKNGDVWVDVSEGELGVRVDGWAIVGNDFSRSTAFPDIRFGSGTAGNIVGEGQNIGVVTDESGQNINIEASTSSSRLFRQLDSRKNHSVQRLNGLLKPIIK